MSTRKKIQRLLDSDDKEFHLQAGELILGMADPQIDAWVLASLREKLNDDPTFWDRAPAPTLTHRQLTAEVVLEVLRRSGRGRLPGRLYVEWAQGVPLDLAPYASVPGLTELIVRVAPRFASSWHHWAQQGKQPVSGLDALAGLPDLADLVIVGGDTLDLAPLTASRSLRRLSLFGCTLAGDHLDLSAGGLHRLDLYQVPGTRSVSVPPGLRELHLRELPELTAIHGLPAALDCTDLSCVDVPSLTDLPEPPPAPRRIRLTAPRLRSIAGLAGRPLERLDLTGCGALESLDGVPTVIDGHLSLNGCAGLLDLTPLAATTGDGLRVLDLRGASAVTDLAPVAGWRGVGVVALYGTGTRPETVPPSLLPVCTFAHTPDLDLLGARAVTG